MSKFHVDTVNAWVQQFIDDLGPDPWLDLYTGPREASATAPATGINTHQIALPTSPFTTPSGGLTSKSGTWTANAINVGVIGHGRFMNNARTKCVRTCTVTQAVAYELTADAAVNTNVFNVADTSAVQIGQGVAGLGVEPGTVVSGKGVGTINLSKVLKSTMLSGDTIVVGDTTGPLLISGAYIAQVGDPVTVAAYAFGWPDLV